MMSWQIAMPDVSRMRAAPKLMKGGAMITVGVTRSMVVIDV
jgi:hypothetical protein